ncbi:hypothetical protein KA017_00635 [Candidatus Woesebacteria bacterium]|nr:hypothetical protein [Candidatus Woesebacteria bacterium]
MSKAFIYLPDSFAKVSTYEVGTYAKELAALDSLGIPVPKSIVIPHNTLKIIAQANNLQAKIYKLIQEIDYSNSVSKEKARKQLMHAIQRQSIPKELASELLSHYHEYFKKSFVLVKNSEKLPFADIIVANIHSDTNFVETILEVWAKISATKLEKLMLGTNYVHDILFPSPILVQQQFEPSSSGVAYSFDLNDGNKSRITIHSSWGVFQKNGQESDTYTVDVRTKNIISKQTQTKLTQHRRVLGKIRSDEVLVKHQNSETITPEQLKIITATVSTIKRKYLSQIEVFWAIENNQIHIESVLETDIQLPEKAIVAAQKIFVTVNSAESATKIVGEPDGIAVLDSGKLLFASATHPSEVVKTSQRKYLVEAIARTLSKYITRTNKPLLYRANNYTSAEFSKLQFASLYEVTELNPALGFRGGLRLLSLPEAFKIELESLKKVLETSKQKITLILPFVRSPEEATRLVQVVERYGLTQNPQFSIWLELATPENVLNLSQYPLQLVQGFLFNTRSIHSLVTGIDLANPDIASHYNQNVLLLKKLIQNSISTIKEKALNQSLLTKHTLFIDLTEFNKELLEQVSDLEIDGFIVNQEVTEFTKTCIMNTTQNTIL